MTCRVYWSKWYMIKNPSSKSGVSIRRYCKVDGKTKWQRLPAKFYSHLSIDKIDEWLTYANDLRKDSNGKDWKILEPYEF